MINRWLTALCIAVSFAFAAFACHKFYVAIFQIDYNSDKKRLQITARIFEDDLNHALEKKYGRAFHLGESGETPADVAQLRAYLSENFSVSVNGKSCPIEFLSSEKENTVLICYLRATGIAGVQTMSVTNKILFDFVTDQQNIIQTNVGRKKQNLLLTIDNPSGTISFEP